MDINYDEWSVHISIIRRGPNINSSERQYTPNEQPKHDLWSSAGPRLGMAANTTQKETQHTVKRHGYWTKLFLKHLTIECQTLITPSNLNPI